MRTRSLHPLFGAALIAAAPLAFASANAPPHGRTSGVTATSQTSTPSAATAQLTEARAQALQSAKVSLTQAIETAQSMHGKAFFARFELRRSKPYYLLRTFQKQQEWVGLIDADNGRVVGDGRMYPESKLTAEQMRDVRALRTAHTSLWQAVRDAEQHQFGAKVLQASLLAARNGKATYSLDLVQNDHVRVAMINPQNGKLE